MKKKFQRPREAIFVTFGALPKLGIVCQSYGSHLKFYYQCLVNITGAFEILSIDNWR